MDQYDLFESEMLKREPPSPVYSIKMEIDEQELSGIDWCADPASDHSQKLCRGRRESGLHQCEFCRRIFLNRYNLIEHNLVHLKVVLSKQPVYACQHCSSLFIQKNSLTEHLAQEHTQRSRNLYECDVCNKKYTYKHLQDHLSSVHSKTSYKCRLCLKIYKCKRYLNKHRAKVHRKPAKVCERSNPYPCYICTKSFNKKDLLNKHVRNVHSDHGGKKFKCEICSSVLRSPVYLRTHMLRVHYDDGKVHRCNICKRPFKSPRYLRVHKKNSKTCRKIYEKIKRHS